LQKYGLLVLFETTKSLVWMNFELLH
jgi:hypothetical protein